MFITCITVYVKEEFVEEFISATLENQLASLKEAGNLRFDFLQCLTDSCRFFFYEAYETEAASASHKKTEHYEKWKLSVAQMMAKPREGITHKVLGPLGIEKWK